METDQGSQSQDASYIQERLNSLYEIDLKLVSMLDNLSQSLVNLKQGKLKSLDSSSTSEDYAPEFKAFKTHTSAFYSDLSTASIQLRKEIRLLDNKSNAVESSNSTESVTILPINVNKKATWLGKTKLNEELKDLKEMYDAEEKSEAIIDDEDVEMN